MKCRSVYFLLLFSVIIPCLFGISRFERSCLTCLCDMISGCSYNQCTQNVCGPFHITQKYWQDAGGFARDGDNSRSNQQRYRNCAVNQNCARRTVLEYVRRYYATVVDCNGDNRFTCVDWAHLHINGPELCEDSLPEGIQYALDACLSQSRIQ